GAGCQVTGDMYPPIVKAPRSSPIPPDLAKCRRRGVMRGLVLLPLLLAALFGDPPRARADALIMTRAMTAPSIMEVFIELKQIRIELESGAGKLEAFQTLLPDKLRAGIGLEAPPLRDRFPRFLLEDLTVRLDGGKPLPALVEKMETRKRLR